MRREYFEKYPNFQASVWSVYLKLKSPRNSCVNCTTQKSVSQPFYPCANLLATTEDGEEKEICKNLYCLSCLKKYFVNKILFDIENETLLKCPTCFTYGHTEPDLVCHKSISDEIDSKNTLNSLEEDEVSKMTPTEAYAYSLVHFKNRKNKFLDEKEKGESK